MPWTKADVESKIKGLSDKQKEVWVEVANKALASCLADGRSTATCEASAIRQANTVAKGVKESMAPDEAQQLILDFMSAQRPEIEEAELLGDLVPLDEKAVRKDGVVSVKLIQPGWGSSGYYPPDVLERDGPKVFMPGTQMFWNHPTETEARERPERDLRDLAGELVSPACYKEDGSAGPGLYADAKVFSGYQEAINELAPHIGVSIRAMGRVKEGEADGRKGKLVQEISSAVSADYVTAAGAGGQVLELFESARGGKYEPNNTRRDDVTEEEAKALQEANEAQAKENAGLKAELARLREAGILRGAKDFVVGKVAGTDMPDITRARLIEALSQNPPIKDGKLDEEALAKTVEAGITEELAYLAKVQGSGQIKGMGPTGSNDADDKLEEAFGNLYRSQGMGADESKKLAALAADRR